MDSSRLSERVGVGRVGVLGVAAVALALAMGGCSADYVENSRASVLFQVADVNGGAVWPLASSSMSSSDTLRRVCSAMMKILPSRASCTPPFRVPH